jgi:hypothetical protein
MSIIKNVGALVSELRDNVTRQGLGDRKDIGALALSAESMDESGRVAAVAARDSLESVISDSIDLIMSRESAGSKLTAAQRDAASRIASLAIDPRAGMQAIAQAKSPRTSQGALSVEAQDLGVIDAVDASTLSTEAFDGQSMNNALYFSIAYNLFAARQDEFGETFFPTITIDPAMSGIAIGTDVTSLYTDFNRATSGAPDAKRFNKITLSKAIYDNNLMGADRNKVLPVSRAGNAAMLLPALNHSDNSTGETITTAPLLIGKEVNLLGISQTDAMLAKGTMDAYDALDRTINLTSVIISLSTTGAGAVTEYFRVPVGMLPYSNFAYTAQGHDKDLSLAFDTVDVAFLTSSTVMHNGSASTILAALPVGHRVKLHLKLNGDGNTQYGDVAVYAVVADVDSIYDAAGNLLTNTAAAAVTILAEFASLKVEGYELEAYLTNTNLRKQGQLVTIDHYEQSYSVPVRSGVSVVMPVNASNSDDSRLVGQIQTTGYRMNLAAVETLVSYANNLNVLTANGANTDIAVMGVGRYHVDPFYNEAVLDLATIVDSESSSERADDIREALVATIRDKVYAAYIDSKFNIANTMIHGNDSKVGVIIGTSYRIKNYLVGDDGVLDLGSDFVAKVVATPNVSIGDTMYITFSDHMSGDRNKAVDPISFGCCLWAPTISTDVSTTINGAVTRRFQTMPRFLQICHLPIIIKLVVTNIAAVLGKVSSNRHTV